MSTGKILNATASITSGLAALFCFGYATTRLADNSITTDLQDQVKEHNISQKEYEAIEKRANEQGRFFSDTRSQLVWQKALDSLQTEAACKKAYLEGAQMVRDSIANSKKAE